MREAWGFVNARGAEAAATEGLKQKMADTGASRLGRGVLSVVEAKFYRVP